MVVDEMDKEVERMEAAEKDVEVLELRWRK